MECDSNKYPILFTAYHQINSMNINAKNMSNDSNSSSIMQLDNEHDLADIIDSIIQKLLQKQIVVCLRFVEYFFAEPLVFLFFF